MCHVFQNLDRSFWHKSMGSSKSNLKNRVWRSLDTENRACTRNWSVLFLLLLYLGEHGLVLWVLSVISSERSDRGRKLWFSVPIVETGFSLQQWSFPGTLRLLQEGTPGFAAIGDLGWEMGGYRTCTKWENIYCSMNQLSIALLNILRGQITGW